MELMALSTKVCSKCGMVLPLNMFYKNVRWISSRANRLKSDASIDELKKVLKYMEEQIGEH